MTKLEKVITGLTCHVHGEPDTRCFKCPYWGTGLHGFSECSVLAADCLDLLMKEPEPHLIAESDFVSADSYGYIPAWAEERNGDQFWKCITRRAIEGDKKRLRYWSDRPTDEQRKAVKWDVEA